VSVAIRYAYRMATNTDIVLLRMSTELLETCRGFK